MAAVDPSHRSWIVSPDGNPLPVMVTVAPGTALPVTDSRGVDDALVVTSGLNRIGITNRVMIALIGTLRLADRP
jgi:hypothetical protein